MLLAEQRLAELEARGTSGSNLKKATALSLLLLLNQLSGAAASIREERFTKGSTVGTGAELFSLKITEIDLFSQINRIYDDLLKNQVDLDPDAKRALYDGLWDLYT